MNHELEQVSDTLQQVHDARLLVYLLLGAIAVLKTVIIVLWKKLDNRTNEVIKALQENASQDREFGNYIKDISKAIHENNAAAAKELIAKLQAVYHRR